MGDMSAQEHANPHHGPSLATYFLIFGALLLLTGLTVWVAFLDLGPLNTVVALLIAVTKATLVLLFFMHLLYSSKLTQVFAGAGFFWLLIAFTLSMADYGTRVWDALPKGWE